MKSLIYPGIQLAVVVLCSQRATIPGPTAVAACEELARQISLLSTGDVLYDRLDVRAGDSELTQNNLLLASLLASNHRVEDLRPLCQHADPKVRTLAIVALFASEDPHVLPDLAPLATDEAETFPGPTPTAGIRGNSTVRQTVGDVARRALEVYLHSAGYWYGVAGANGHPGFDGYWAIRKDRTSCASWLAVRLARARQGSNPVPANRLSRAQALQKQVNALPEPDRYLDLLWMSLPDRCDAFADEEDLLQAARSLGRERLLQILQRKVPTDDPDLQSRDDGPYPCQLVVAFVLEHAKSLLERKDGALLLECGRQERQSTKRGLDYRMLTPWWSIAAAELQPEKGNEILHEEFQRYPEGGSYTDAWNRSDLMSALWRVCGTSEEGFLVDRFYREPLEHQGVPTSRCKFLNSFTKDSSAPVRVLFAHVIADPRFDTLDWSSLKAMIAIVNSWTKQPVVSLDETRDLGHVLGEQRFIENVAKAEEKYPEETRRVLATLATWREHLRASVKEWQP